MSQRGGGANLRQPANLLTVSSADGCGEEAAETASIGEQLQDACREEKVNCRGEGGGRGRGSVYLHPPSSHWFIVTKTLSLC